MKFNDAISGSALLALAVAIVAYGHGLPAMPGQFVGPGEFPVLVGAALGIGAIILIVKGLRARATQPWARFDDWLRQPRLLLRFVAIPVFVLVYVVLSEAIGFVPVAFAGLAALYALAGVRWQTALLVAVATTAVVYYAFAVILRVPLPRTELWGLPF